MGERLPAVPTSVLQHWPLRAKDLPLPRGYRVCFRVCQRSLVHSASPDCQGRLRPDWSRWCRLGPGQRVRDQLQAKVYRDRDRQQRGRDTRCKQEGQLDLHSDRVAFHCPQPWLCYRPRQGPVRHWYWYRVHHWLWCRLHPAVLQDRHRCIEGDQDQVQQRVRIWLDHHYWLRWCYLRAHHCLHYRRQLRHPERQDCDWHMCQQLLLWRDQEHLCRLQRHPSVHHSGFRQELQQGRLHHHLDDRDPHHHSYLLQPADDHQRGVP